MEEQLEAKNELNKAAEKNALEKANQLAKANLEITRLQERVRQLEAKNQKGVIEQELSDISHAPLQIETSSAGLTQLINGFEKPCRAVQCPVTIDEAMEIANRIDGTQYETGQVHIPTVNGPIESIASNLWKDQINMRFTAIENSIKILSSTVIERTAANGIDKCSNLDRDSGTKPKHGLTQSAKRISISSDSTNDNDESNVEHDTSTRKSHNSSPAKKQKTFTKSASHALKRNKTYSLVSEEYISDEQDNDDKSSKETPIRNYVEVNECDDNTEETSNEEFNLHDSESEQEIRPLIAKTRGNA